MGRNKEPFFYRHITVRRYMLLTPYNFGNNYQEQFATANLESAIFVPGKMQQDVKQNLVALISAMYLLSSKPCHGFRTHGLKFDLIIDNIRIF